jgi:hypothetical protein
MKSNPKPSAEYTNFENAMRAIMRAPKAEVNRVLAEEKVERAKMPRRGPKPKISTLGHASDGKA